MSTAVAPDFDRETFAILRARCERSAAERDAALDALERVVKLIDRRGFMTPEHQQVVRDADVVLVEAGRRPR